MQVQLNYHSPPPQVTNFPISQNILSGTIHPMMSSKSNSSVQRVKDDLRFLNIPVTVQELPGSAKTAKEAAMAAKCQVGQIVKSLVFQTVSSNEPILILTSGSNKVDENIAGAQLGAQIHFASPDFVREETGFAIGGVSPYGLKKEIPIYIDRDLMEHSIVWVAAGSHHAIFSIDPQTLVNSTGCQVISVH